jgi:hypothetical protein
MGTKWHFPLICEKCLGIPKEGDGLHFIHSLKMPEAAEDYTQHWIFIPLQHSTVMTTYNMHNGYNLVVLTCLISCIFFSNWAGPNPQFRPQYMAYRPIL